MSNLLSNNEQMVVDSVLSWYEKEQRTLPWRETHNPYYILISEVMLQQTQVSRVIEKFREFVGKFPTVFDLAAANTSDVLIVWKGLGYNRRALFLQKTAQAVVSLYGGNFPQDLARLKELPGVGDYTARAILSFAFQVPVPMMDTNHRRFYQRVLFGTDLQSDKVLLEKAEKILPKKDAYNWNQALMDFGSSLCLTRNPKCDDCPIATLCKAKNGGKENFWVMQKKPKKKSVPFRETDRYYRGRIIDLLRESATLPVSALHSHFCDIPKERLDKILAGLKKDSLIVIIEQTIHLP